MTFALDTSGEVDLTIAEGIPAEIAGGHRWSDLSPFTQGYIEALFASSWSVLPGFMATRDQPLGDAFRTQAVGFSDLAPETLARIIADCEARLRHCPSEGRGDVRRSNGWPVRHNGNRFWTWRQNGQCKNFPPLTVQLGDDGKVRFAPTPERAA